MRKPLLWVVPLLLVAACQDYTRVEDAEQAAPTIVPDRGEQEPLAPEPGVEAGPLIVGDSAGAGGVPPEDVLGVERGDDVLEERQVVPEPVTP